MCEIGELAKSRRNMGGAEIIEREVELAKMMKREERIIGMEVAPHHHFHNILAILLLLVVGGGCGGFSSSFHPPLIGCFKTASTTATTTFSFKTSLPSSPASTPLVISSSSFPLWCLRI
uniref:Uncharacterized protein n=1 Tax=Salix viminalis TaxID=40686 RepID=A0A6N2L361_SALVM